MPGKHARLSASSSERWMACPGSISLIEGMPKVPRQSTTYAHRGTCLHAVARDFLTMPDEAAKRWVPDAVITEEGVPYTLTEDDLEGVELYLDCVRAIRGLNPVWEGVEVELEMSDIHPDFGGMADYAALVKDTSSRATLFIVDLKNGTGVTVNPENNPQAMKYAIGVLNRLRNQRIDRVIISIVQPFAAYGDKVKVWETTPGVLYGFITELLTAADKVNSPNPELHSGEWCRWCPAITVCPLHADDFQTLAVRPQKPLAMSDAELGNILLRYNILKPWLDEIYATALQRAETGAKIDGMKLVPKRATRKWIDETMIPPLLRAAKVDEEDIYTKKVVSPAQAEKAFGKKFYNVTLAAEVEKKSSGFNLVPEYDEVKGPDLTPSLPSPDKLGL